MRKPLELSDAAREAQRAYYRELNAKKGRAYREAYWEKYAIKRAAQEAERAAHQQEDGGEQA